MIKRRFYRAEHTEKDAASDSSSDSDSDSNAEIAPQISDNNDVTDNDTDDVSDNGSDDVTDSSSLRQHPPVISSSGYESEESSGNAIDVNDTSGLIAVDEDDESESDKELLDIVTSKTKPEALPDADNITNCVLKSKSVFKCRLCPKIVCLNEESLATHLKSKRHSRSEKLLNDGRLKRFLNSDGEEEVVSDDEDGETHAERHARILALAQADLATKKSRGRQRQRQRLKQKQPLSELQKEAPFEEKPSSESKKDNRAKRRKKPGSKSKKEPKKDNRAKRRKKNVD